MTSRHVLFVALVVTGCTRKPQAAAAPAGDAGPRAVTVKLGRPVTEIAGDAWPRDPKRTSSMHELKGPLLLTVELPSGRRFTLAAPSVLASTDDHHWPTLHDPPETAPPNLELLHLSVGRFATLDEAVSAVEPLLATVGVSAVDIATEHPTWGQKGPHHQYPYERCVYAEASIEPISGRFVATLTLGLSRDCALDAGP